MFSLNVSESCFTQFCRFLSESEVFGTLKMSGRSQLISKVAIVSAPGPELKAIRNEVMNPSRFLVREFLSLEEVNMGLRAFSFDVLIMRLPVFDTPQVAIVLKLRSIFPSAGIVTVCPQIQPGARYQIRDVVRHKLLHEGTELSDLHRVVDKFVRGEINSTRLHPRVRRDGDCELVDPVTGARFRGRFLDFAQMGARVVINSGKTIGRNTRLVLQYWSTTERGRLQRIESNVVWTEICGNGLSGLLGTMLHGPMQEVGLRFIAAL